MENFNIGTIAATTTTTIEEAATQKKIIIIYEVHFNLWCLAVIKTRNREWKKAVRCTSVSTEMEIRENLFVEYINKCECTYTATKCAQSTDNPNIFNSILQFHFLVFKLDLDLIILRFFIFFSTHTRKLHGAVDIHRFALVSIIYGCHRKRNFIISFFFFRSLSRSLGFICNEGKCSSGMCY